MFFFFYCFLYSRTASTVAGVQISNATRKVAATREAAICRPIIYVCAAGSVGGDFFLGEVYGVGKCMQKLSHRECASEKQVLNWCYSLSRSLFFSCCCHCLPCQADPDLLSLLWLTEALSLALSPTYALSNITLLVAKLHTLRETERERDRERIKRQFRSVQSFVAYKMLLCFCCVVLLLLLFLGVFSKFNGLNQSIVSQIHFRKPKIIGYYKMCE